MDSAERKALRRIAHHLHPVVMIGDGGVSEAVIAETHRALDDHELIKVKVNAMDREDRTALTDALADVMAERLSTSGRSAGRIVLSTKKATKIA